MFTVKSEVLFIRDIKINSELQHVNEEFLNK